MKIMLVNSERNTQEFITNIEDLDVLQMTLQKSQWIKLYSEEFDEWGLVNTSYVVAVRVVEDE